MDLKFQPDLELFTSVRGKRLLWIFTLFFVLMPVSGYAQREAKEQKIKNTEALRRVLINLARWDLSIVAERQKVQEDWARLRPKLLLSERRAFDEAFAPIQSGKANAEDVENFYRKLFDRFDVYASPAQTPDPQLGMNVYRDHCATCHGKNADGKSELAHAKIFQKSRPPTDFTDASFLIRSTPFRIYNVLLQGIPNTAKAAYATRLTDHQMWSVSFVLQGISSLRTLATFEKCRSDARLKDKIMVTSAKDFSLQQLATSSDSVLLNFFGPNDPNTRLGVARCRAPFDSTTRR